MTVQPHYIGNVKQYIQIQLENGEGCLKDYTAVNDVIIENCTFNGVYAGIGAHVELDGANGLYNRAGTEPGRNIKIIGNTFKDIKEVALNLWAHEDVEIVGNKVEKSKNSGKGVAFVATYNKLSPEAGINIDELSNTGVKECF